MEKILKLLKDRWTYAVSTIVGGVGGYLYWYNIGCTTGSCPMTSSPIVTILSGALLGSSLLSIFSANNKNKEDKQVD